MSSIKLPLLKVRKEQPLSAPIVWATDHGHMANVPAKDIPQRVVALQTPTAEPPLMSKSANMGT